MKQEDQPQDLRIIAVRTLALRMVDTLEGIVIPGILETIRRAIREPAIDGANRVSAITHRPPSPEECDSSGRIWIWSRKTATEPPGWILGHYSEITERADEGLDYAWRHPDELPLED